MSKATRDKQLNYHWFQKLVTGQPHVVLFQDEQPYLIRRFLIPRNSYFNIYLHKFVRSDYDEALHDHPWWFISLILKGAYTEYTPEGRERRKAGSIAYRPATHMHRVQLDSHPVIATERTRVRPTRQEIPTWTLIVTGKKVREWGFACPKAWVPWEKFTGGSYNHSVGCGEYA